MTTITAYAANRNLEREKASRADAMQELARLEASALAYGVINAKVDIAAIAEARLAIEFADARVADAEAIAAQADAGIDATDNYAAEALLELLEDNRYELRLLDHNIVCRKRPGKAVPKTLPEVCVSQQENSEGDGIYSVNRLFITVYADTAVRCNLDTRKLAEIINRKGMRLSGIGNTAPVETLDGGYRKTFMVDKFRGHLNTPRVLAPLSAQVANNLGVELAGIARGLNQNGTAHTAVGLWTRHKADSGKVISDGPERAVEVTIEIGTSGQFAGWSIDGIKARFETRLRDLSGVRYAFGRITGAEMVATKPFGNGGEYTIRVTGEAQTG